MLSTIIYPDSKITPAISNCFCIMSYQSTFTHEGIVYMLHVEKLDYEDMDLFWCDASKDEKIPSVHIRYKADKVHWVLMANDLNVPVTIIFKHAG